MRRLLKILNAKPLYRNAPRASRTFRSLLLPRNSLKTKLSLASLKTRCELCYVHHTLNGQCCSHAKQRRRA